MQESNQQWSQKHKESSDFNEVSISLANVFLKAKVFLSLLKIKLRDFTGMVNVRAVIDIDSHKSYIF